MLTNPLVGGGRGRPARGISVVLILQVLNPSVVERTTLAEHFGVFHGWERSKVLTLVCIHPWW
jgi:hypothetical protein